MRGKNVVNYLNYPTSRNIQDNTTTHTQTETWNECGKYADALVKSECYDLSAQVYERAMQMTDNAWFVVNLKLKYADMKIAYKDNTKNDFQDTIHTGFRVLTELQSEVVEMRKMSTITKEERDRVLGHTCALDIEYYASGQSMGLCSAFAEIAPYSAMARAGTLLIDGYWRGDFKTVDENLPILLEICWPSLPRHGLCVPVFPFLHAYGEAQQVGDLC